MFCMASSKLSPFFFVSIKSSKASQIVYGYELSKGLLGFIFSFFKKGEWKFCFRPLYYKYFDSFERAKLPKKDFVIWDKSKAVEVS